jgi:RNA polymerase sigma factor (TIGR02999 family)
MADVTQILDALKEGDTHAANRLLEAVYHELRCLASNRLSKEKPGQTLQATALVHEAWIKLVGNQRTDWQSRGHFFAAAAEAMRRILVDRARRKARLKHGGDRRRVDLDYVDHFSLPPRIDLIALDEALDRLTVEEPVKAELVKLRFFTGITMKQAAEILGISKTTADRYWAYARAWLYSDIKRGSKSK